MEPVTYILNYGHPLTERVRKHLAPCVELIIPNRYDRGEPTIPQIVNLLTYTERLVEEKGGFLDGSVPIVVQLPPLSEFAAALVAELHGRLGVFPRILSVRPDRVTGVYNLFGDSAYLGVLDLEATRMESRGRRKARVVVQE